MPSWLTRCVSGCTMRSQLRKVQIMVIAGACLQSGTLLGIVVAKSYRSHLVFQALKGLITRLWQRNPRLFDPSNECRHEKSYGTLKHQVPIASIEWDEHENQMASNMHRTLTRNVHAIAAEGSFPMDHLIHKYAKLRAPHHTQPHTLKPSADTWQGIRQYRSNSCAKKFHPEKAKDFKGIPTQNPTEIRRQLKHWENQPMIWKHRNSSSRQAKKHLFSQGSGVH